MVKVILKRASGGEVRPPRKRVAYALYPSCLGANHIRRWSWINPAFMF